MWTISFLDIFFIAFIFRYLIARKAPIDFDTYGHLYFAKEVKKQKVGPFGKIKLNVVGNEGYSHPFLWHWLIGIFPILKVLKYQKLINPFIDSIFTVFIFYISTQIGFSQNESLTAAIIYIFTPMWFSRMAIGPRISSLTPRLFSEILSNIFFIVTLLPLGLPYWIVIIIGAMISCMALVSTKFGIQALFFLTPVISLLTKNSIPVYALICGLLLSILISKKKILYSFKEQYFHLREYYSKNISGKTPISNRNSIKHFWISLGERHKGTKKKLMAIIQYLLTRNSYTSVLFKMPILIIIILLFFNNIYETGIVVPNYLIMPVIGSVIIYLIINMKRFLFLGEAERYLNHIAFFIIMSLLFFSSKMNMMWILNYLLGYGFLYWFFETLFLSKLIPSNLSIQKCSDEIKSYLQNENTQLTILSYPYHCCGGFYRLMLETTHSTIFDYLDNTVKGNQSCWYSDIYPFVKLDVVDKMHDELGVNFLIIDNKQLKRRKEGWEPSSLWKKLEVGFPVYTVYSINE
jgi:hypothetical protein